MGVDVGAIMSNGVNQIKNNNIVGFVTDLVVAVVILIVIATVGQRLWNYGVQPLLPNVVSKCDDPKQLISLAIMISLLVPGGRLQGSNINITRQVTDMTSNVTGLVGINDVTSIDGDKALDASGNVIGQVVDAAGTVVNNAGQVMGSIATKAAQVVG